jgi:hypothetical protein
MKKRKLSCVQHKAREGKACKKHITFLWLFCQTLERDQYLLTIFELFLRARAFVCVCVLEGRKSLKFNGLCYFKLLRGIGWFVSGV